MEKGHERSSRSYGKGRARVTIVKYTQSVLHDQGLLSRAVSDMEVGHFSHYGPL